VEELLLDLFLKVLAALAEAAVVQLLRAWSAQLRPSPATSVVT